MGPTVTRLVQDPLAVNFSRTHYICHRIPIWKLHNDMSLGIIPSSRVARWQRCWTNIKWCSVNINSLDINSLKLWLVLFYMNNSRWLKATLNIDKTDECKWMNLTENLTLRIRPKKIFFTVCMTRTNFNVEKLNNIDTSTVCY